MIDRSQMAVRSVYMPAESLKSPGKARATPYQGLIGALLMLTSEENFDKKKSRRRGKSEADTKPHLHVMRLL
jgi:hypothetical protein